MLDLDTIYFFGPKKQSVLSGASDNVRKLKRILRFQINCGIFPARWKFNSLKLLFCG